MTKFLFTIAVLFSTTYGVFAQKTDTLIKKLDSLHREEQKPGNKPVIESDKEDFTSQTNITFKGYFVLLGTDLVQEVTSPFHAKKSTWLQVGGFVALEGALLLADKPIKQYSTQIMDQNPGAQNVSTYITNFGGVWEGYTLAAFGLYGIVFKSNRVKTATLLATQSYITAGAVSSLVKGLTGRERPHSTDNNTIFRGPYLASSGHGNSLGSSFPSGHTTAAFSVATVFAQEFRDRPAIPIIAYAAATLVGISRITENAHWATDVFAGAALGYVTGKQVSRNYHRYARLRNGKQKTALLLNLQYYDGVIMPGLVYKF
ncbi:MAG: phosphatase family protein [Flavipsychrobacter sp.]|nr:phosphatase family protein [Flavipsychrobacter sp.]